jgi:hypothetical protein
VVSPSANRYTTPYTNESRTRKFMFSLKWMRWLPSTPGVRTSTWPRIASDLAGYARMPICETFASTAGSVSVSFSRCCGCPSAPCWFTPSHLLGASAFFALVPIPLAWLFVYVAIWTLRWVWRGFQPAA